MKKLFLSLAGISLVASSSIFAADEDLSADSKYKMLDKIITSSSGFDLSLKDEAKNVYVFDKEDLQDKGYSSLQQALQYQPFITFSDSGFGSDIDLRGQGLDANRAVKLLVNRVPISLLDTSHGVPAYNNIDLEDIESIEVIPGGGAVVYGNGTRGGVINIVTKKHARDFYRGVLKLTSGERLGLQGAQLSLAAGKRAGDSLFFRGGLNVGYTPNIRNTQGTLSTNNNTKAFSNDFNTNIYVSFQTIYDINSYNKLDFNISYSHLWTNYPYDRLLLSTGANGRFEPDQNTIKTQTDSMQTSLNYTATFSDTMSFDALAFYQFSIVRYTQYQKGVPGQAGFMNFGKSGFQNHGGGINAKLKWQLDKNTLILGLDNILEHSLRVNFLNHIVTAGGRPPGGLFYTTDATNTATKLSNSLYAFDTYKINENFELNGGARIEFSNYWSSNINDLDFSISTFSGTDVFRDHQSRLGYAAEITPNYKYSESGNVYGKAEVGFISPSAYQMINADPNASGQNSALCSPRMQRFCNVSSNNIEPEQYLTLEVGWKDYFEYSYVSATIFYTHTFNEIFVNNISHGVAYTYGNLGQTQRLGLEILATQSFGENDWLKLTESISPLFSNVLKTNGVNDAIKGKLVPYVPWLKVTFGISADIFRNDSSFLSAFINNAYYSQSNALDGSGTETIYTARIMNKYGYLLTDIGLNYGYGNLKVNAGIRNLFNAWYATYQKGDTYQPGFGRSYYVELRYALGG